MRSDGDRLKPWDSLKLDACEAVRMCSSRPSLLGREKLECGIADAVGVTASLADAADTGLAGLSAGISKRPGVSMAGEMPPSLVGEPPSANSTGVTSESSRHRSIVCRSQA